MKLGLLTSESSWYFRDLQRASTAADELTPLMFSSLAAGIGGEESSWVTAAEQGPLHFFDAILVRAMPPGSLEEIVFRMNALHRLHVSGTSVFNHPRCLEVAIDKFLASALLSASGLRIPRTLTCQTVDDAMQAFQSLGGDAVIKPLFGSEGKGITRVTDEAVAWRAFKALVQLGSVIYLQQYIPHHGHDIRLLVIGDQVLGIRRHNAQDWRTNISRGGHAEPLEMNDELQQTAVCAAEAVQSSLVAVDVLPGRDGLNYVLEVNAVPGWRALARTLKLDVSSLVLRWIRTQVS